MSNKYNVSSADPIGVFDSGIGGLTVVKCIQEQLPHENIIYLGDIARLPYGTKSVATVKKFALQTCNFILKQKVKAIVIACNTISAVAKNEIIVAAGNIPVVDVISAGSRASAFVSKNNRVGVIATPVTIESNAYPKAINQLNDTVQVFSQACSLFVPLIEDGFIDHYALELIVHEYLASQITHNVDTLILGCTHYPIIKATIRKVVGDQVNIIDPAVATCSELSVILQQQNLLNPQITEAKYRFFVTEISPNFTQIANTLLSAPVTNPELITL